ncbi:MAG: 30S ribosomal protein S3 [Candidatus Thorarchaeota archaeon]|nr:MAG: 30S ribosomal protein S3 [Candidatus Thorarchaeota archaeon]
MSAVKYFIEQNSRKLAIDEFLAHELNAAGYGGVEIRKMPTKTEVVIEASRPGVVIGRRGAKIRELSEILETEFGIENAQLEVAEIENPWLNAQVMASRLARQLERGIRFRRMAYWILRRVMRAGAIGCEILVKGKLSSRRARYQKFKQGTIAKTGEPADIFVDEGNDTATLKPGVIGIKVRIMRPDAKLPGVVHVKKPKVKKRVIPEIVEKVEEEVLVTTDAEVIDEDLEGITDMEELIELEELDGLDLIDEEPEEVEDTPTETNASGPEEEVTEEQPPEEKVEPPADDLKELEDLDGGD